MRKVKHGGVGNLACENVLVLDFGGHHSQLVARMIREEKVYCEVHPYTIGMEKIKKLEPKAVVLCEASEDKSKETALDLERELFQFRYPYFASFPWKRGAKLYDKTVLIR